MRHLLFSNEKIVTNEKLDKYSNAQQNYYILTIFLAPVRIRRCKFCFSEKKKAFNKINLNLKKF